MPTLTEEFDALDASRVDAYVDTQQEEHLSLDFKRANSADVSSSDDREHFAKALAGFANAEGGILIWGVGTGRRQAAGGGGQVEFAQDRLPIVDTSIFMGRLNALESSLVHPRVEGVRHKRLPPNQRTGYVATLIPQSDAGPHMAKQGVDRFIRRHGDSFQRMEHYEVADMFGRRVRPLLVLETDLKSGARGGLSRGVGGEVALILRLHNSGRGSAIAPYLAVGTQRPFKVGVVGSHLAFSVEVDPPEALAGRAIADTTTVIHPNVTFAMLAVRGEILDIEPVPDLTVNFSIGSLNSPLKSATLTIPAADVAAVLHRPIAAPS